MENQKTRGAIMGKFLNNSNAYLNYQRMVKSAFFVDKTRIIEELLISIEQDNRWLCFTRPRRFGKSVMANMVAAYFGDACDSHEIFDQLEISKSAKYQQHLNQHHVIHIDFSRTPLDCNRYQQYIAAIRDGIQEDIARYFPETQLKQNESPWDALEKTGQTFLFVLDEWDAVFHMSFMNEQDKSEHMLFLKNLLKDRAYVDLAYMTGVLPITKYSSGSELNMFMEYSMIGSQRFSGYFGFSDQEVDQLYEIYQKNTEKAAFSREELRLWYDGYYNALGQRLYNPRSVVCALTNNQLESYWTSSGPYDEVFHYIKNNTDDVREDIALMVSGERVPAKVREYAATARELNTKNQIYSAMVVYGLLTYCDGEVLIPNKELMDKFNELLMEKQELGYVHQLARRSETMLKATLAGDTDTMAEIMDLAHNTGRILLVGIGYDPKTKKHSCKVEVLRKEERSEKYE